MHVTRTNGRDTIQKGAVIVKTEKNIRLMQARKQVGLTQVQVADKANITEISYQRIEYGIQRPSLDTAILIAKALNSSVEELF